MKRSAITITILVLLVGLLAPVSDAQRRKNIALFRLAKVRDVPLTKEPLSGVLEYAITYIFKDTGETHHSKKKLRIDLYYANGLSGRYTTLEGHED